MEAHYRPLHTEYVPKTPSFQDGDESVDQIVHTTRGLGNIVRSHRCIPAHSYTHQFSEIPAICCRRQGVHVPGVTVRTLAQPVDIYAGNERCHGLSTLQNFIVNGGLLGRHSRQAYAETGLGGRQRFSASLTAQPWLPGQQGEIRPVPQTTVRSSRDEFQHCNLHGGAYCKTHRQPQGSSGGSARCLGYHAQKRRSDIRPLPGSGRIVTSGPATPTASAMGRHAVAPSDNLLGRGSTHTTALSAGLTALDRHSLAPVESTHSPNHPHAFDMHRCFAAGMGGPLTARLCCRQRRMGARGTDKAYKRARNVGGHEGSTEVVCGLDREVSPDSIRQLDSGGLPQQAGRHQVREFVPISDERLAIRTFTRHRSTGPPHSGEIKRPCRRPIPPTSLCHRVDAGPGHIPVAVGTLPSHDMRSFRHKAQQSATEIYLAVSGPEGSCGRRPVGHMGGQRPVRIPSSSVDSESPDQTGEFCRRVNSHSPPGTTQGVVYDAAEQTPTGTITDTNLSGPTEAATLGCSDGRPSISPSACLQIVRRALKAKGFSSPAVVRIVGSRRKSTLEVYDKKWRRFASWCAENNLHPLRLSSPQLANFFIELFEVDKLQPITIKGYRAAISRVYKLIGASWSPGTDLFLTELLKNFSLERPATNRLLPKWSLEVVLDFLNSSEFEPLPQADLSKMVRKAVFLLTLASAGRISEIHALSAASDCLTFNQDGSVTLLPNATFIAKNRLPEIAPQPFVLFPCLETLNCPVRALRCYLDATQNERDSTLPLWVNPSTKKKATKNLISSWIRNTIKEAYEWTALSRDKPTAVTAISEAVMAGSSASTMAVMAGNSSTSEGPQSNSGHESRMSLRARETRIRRTQATAQSAIPSDGHPVGVMQLGRGVEQGVPTVRVRDCPQQTAAPDLSRPAHELRAIAASLSYRQGTRLQDLLQAVGWQSHSTFGRFYLRHLQVNDPGTATLRVPGRPGTAPIP